MTVQLLKSLISGTSVNEPLLLCLQEVLVLIFSKGVMRTDDI